jgi:flagellar protein FliS
MMAMANPYERYRQQGVMTASPVELIVMLYDGCIKNLKLARIAIQEKKYDTSNTHLQKAQEIIAELISSLDLHFPIAADLMKIYDFILRQIVEINVSKDETAIGGIVGLLSTLKDAWSQVARMNRNAVSAMEE